MIYFIHGPDRSMAREAARSVAEELDPTGENTSWLDGRETAAEGVAAAVGAVSFFGGTRVVIVTDLIARSGRDSGHGDDDPTKSGQAGTSKSVLGLLASAVPESHCLILLEPGLATAPAALKSAAPGAKVIAGEPPRGAALIAWIIEAAQQAGSSIDRRIAHQVAATLYPQTWDRKPNNPRYDRPPDIGLLTQEMEKLALFAHPGAITGDHVGALVTGGPDQRVFRFLDAALDGDLRMAAPELDRLHEAGDEPAMLLAQLLGQIELQTVAKAAGGHDASTVARDLGSISAGRISAVMASARQRAPRERPAAEAGVSVDRALKRGRTRRPEDALHELMLALATSAGHRKTGRPE